MGADVRSGESFSLGQIREFPFSLVESVSKVVLRITKIPLNVVRDNIATRVSDLGQIQVVPPNTRRFTYDPVTLASFGLILAPEGKCLITISNIALWSRTRVTVTTIFSPFTDLIYILQGSGAGRQHNILTPYPTVNFDTYRVLSICMKNGTNRFAQLSVGGDVIFASFDLELGVLGTKHLFIDSIIVPAGDGWYRCSMAISSPNGICLLCIW